MKLFNYLRVVIYITIVCLSSCSQKIELTSENSAVYDLGRDSIYSGDTLVISYDSVFICIDSIKDLYAFEYKAKELASSGITVKEETDAFLHTLYKAYGDTSFTKQIGKMRIKSYVQKRLLDGKRMKDETIDFTVPVRYMAYGVEEIQHNYMTETLITLFSWKKPTADMSERHEALIFVADNEAIIIKPGTPAKLEINSPSILSKTHNATYTQK